MGIVVDFMDGLDAMLDELQETYDGRILSPQGKIIRIMPMLRRSQASGREIFFGQVYVSTLMHCEIYQVLIELPAVLVDGDREEKWREAREELRKMTEEIESEISARGFIIRRGRYVFSGEDPRLAE